MKQFTAREIFEAYEESKAGGQALHVHNFNTAGHKLFARYPETAHLFDMNKERLVSTVKRLGVRVIKIEYEGTFRQHIDLCGKPLEKAKSLCIQVA